MSEVDPTSLPGLFSSTMAKSSITKTAEVRANQIEDWVHRLSACADEAGDERLYPLQSDILDVREELAYLLS